MILTEALVDAHQPCNMESATFREHLGRVRGGRGVSCSIIRFNYKGLDSHGIGGSSRVLLAGAHGNDGGALSDSGRPASYLKRFWDHILFFQTQFPVPTRPPLALPSPSVPPSKQPRPQAAAPSCGWVGSLVQSFQLPCPLCGNAPVSPGRGARRTGCPLAWGFLRSVFGAVLAAC